MMDADFWAVRLDSSKNYPSAARINSADGYIIIGDGDDDVRAWFPCPFCYVEIELPVFCCHLQEFHCFDLKNAVCPICAASLGKDALAHFTLQHAHSVKRRRKSQESVFWDNPPAMTGSKTHREMNSFSNPSHEDEPVVDLLISPFICPFGVDSNDEPHIVSSTNVTLTTDETSNFPQFADPIQEQDYRERQERAVFLQELVYSTIF